MSRFIDYFDYLPLGLFFVLGFILFFYVYYRLMYCVTFMRIICFHFGY